MTLYCECETPLMDVEHDAGCRRCGRPVNFTPSLEDRAREMGADHGRAAASWYFDGNTTDETYRATLAGIEEGDPVIMEALPSSPLSGEWADDPTRATVLEDLGVDPEDDTADDYLRAYEDGFSEASLHEIERIARFQVGDPAERIRTGYPHPIAYTYEAAEHCPSCAARRFGVDDATGFIPEAATDSEGNGIGAIAPWDETFGLGSCDDCGATLYDSPEEA